MNQPSPVLGGGIDMRQRGDTRRCAALFRMAQVGPVTVESRRGWAMWVGEAHGSL